MNNSGVDEHGQVDKLVQVLKTGDVLNGTEENSHARRDGGNFWFKLKKDQHFRSKYILTLAYIASFLTLGWAEGQFGPTFPDLLHITNTTLEKGSLFFTMNTVGYLLGSLLMGFLFDRRLLDRNLLMFLIIAGYGVIIAVIPWCEMYEVMVTVFIVKGSFAGGLDTCGNAGLVTTWGNDGNTYLSALHFAFAVGGILSPLVTAPYVMSLSNNISALNFTNTANSSDIGNSNGSTYHITNHITTYHITKLIPTEKSFEDRSSLIYIPYTVTAGLCVMTSIPFIIFCGISLQKRLDRKTSKEDGKNKTKLDRRLRITGLINILIYIAVYVAVDKSYSSFLTTFITSQLNWTNANGSYLTSGYWASFAVGRFIGIFLVQCVSPAKMLFTFNFMLLISLLGFLLTSLYDVIYFVWLFTLLIGFSLSVTFPVVVMWTEQNFLRVNGKVASMFLVAASIGFIVNPPFLGALMETYTSMWFSYLLFGEAVCLYILYFSGVYISRKIASRHTIIADQELSVLSGT
ncbi:sodium-dependent glucose transporter 1A-like [Saccostrea echinata]|uniref:sodium-dependent glucose transporter 1A-like n=1 Tax=Saccostrea echinata TaxID=191078 RepID=UPI002A7F2AC5|nr:sodium-dependent glucose transporter 1A-like [Saccostrea echinata]